MPRWRRSTRASPRCDRYGDRGLGSLVEGEVYTIEPVVHGCTGVDGHPVGPEQDVAVTADGATFLSTPPKALTIVR